MMEKIVLGLSGGVDSALSAYLLKAQGYEVVGVYLENGSDASADAKKVADDMGIGFMCVDIMDMLREKVINPFIEGYLHAKTPIPCIACNPAVKFTVLFDVADQIGAKYVATGHYARITEGENGEKLLTKAESKNDQSYMLYRLPKEYIERLILPLGGYENKDAVRADSEKYGIHIAKKADSMEICFIPDDDHAKYIEDNGFTPPPGDFVDENGKVLGKHLGIHRYTVGQRRGLGIAAASRLFVTKIDAEKNQVILSFDDLHKHDIEVSAPHIIYNKYLSVDEFDCKCKIRHSKTEYDAHVVKTENGFAVHFPEAARAPSPGQSAVFYEGEYVIGGGYIE
ncbi:MAG: tRNA 2-thiouridine(34) synthase MnmA [Clostridia bacterium]|nr:tRNA 2-thiouridine(34) synthase MnmA [Clostridia bacterium]